LDYEEPIPQVVKRLRKEHTELHSKLERIVAEVKTGNLAVAISLLNLIKPQILRHAVEEEARLTRSIMRESRDESGPSIKIFQQHRRIEEFLQDKLPYLDELFLSQATREIEEFASELEKHHSEEEALVFPLALKSYALSTKRKSKEKEHQEC